MAFKLGDKVIYTFEGCDVVCEIYGYSSMPYNPIPYEYYIQCKTKNIPYKSIDSKFLRPIEYPSISSATHEGMISISGQTSCPISHEEFVNSQEVVQLQNNYIFDKGHLETFWTIKGLPINPVTNLEILYQKDIKRFTVKA